jgi:predicted dehydrogenase
VVGAEPQVVAAEAQCPVPDVDGVFSAELKWDSGVTGSIHCSMIAPGSERELYLRILGDSGTLTVLNPVAPQDGASFVVENAAGLSTTEADSSTTTYLHQLVAFRDAVVSGVSPLTSGTDSIANMELIDSCYLAAGLEPRRRSG